MYNRLFMRLLTLLCLTSALAAAPGDTPAEVTARKLHQALADAVVTMLAPVTVSTKYLTICRSTSISNKFS